MTRRPLSPAVAFAVAAAGIGLFSIMDAFMKSLTLALGVYNALVWRTGLSAIVAGLVWAAAGATRPSARAMRLHLARGGITAIMALLFFWGLARVPMAQAISLAYVAPLLALLGGAWWLGERVGRRVVFASLAALGGVAIVLVGVEHERAGAQGWAGAAAILASAILYAANLLVARLQSQTAPPAEIAFVQSAIVTTILLAAAPWWLALPRSEEWPAIAGAAMLGVSSLFLLAWAYAHGEAGYLATAEYTSFVYAAALGWLVFGEPLALATIVGAGVIVVACLLAARRGGVPVVTAGAAA